MSVKSQRTVNRFFFPLFVFLLLSFALQLPNGNRWQWRDSPAGESQWFQPFDATDWTLLGATALADIGDFASSNAMSYNDRQGNAHWSNWASREPGRWFTPAKGEGNPLITGLYGTKYPRTWQYASWFGGEFLIQSAIAYALPKRWRDAGFGVFIGVGATDTIVSAYGGGLEFKF